MRIAVFHGCVDDVIDWSFIEIRCSIFLSNGGSGEVGDDSF
jgi:hypothetical protein